jgi:hypothetical protein
MSSGNGHNKIDPKWDHYIDQWVREVLDTMGRNLGALGVAPSEQQVAKASMARALCYAAYSIVLESVDEDAEKTKEIVDQIGQSFFAELLGEE